MAHSFSSTEQLHTQFSFLSLMDEHPRLLVDLQGSVLFSTLSALPLPIRDFLQSILIARYGGTPPNLSVTRVRLGFLVRLPDWILPNDLNLDAVYWQQTQGLLVLPWQSLDISEILPPRQRVRVTIRGFPVDYWHPFYFRQASTSMGVLVGISCEGLCGEDRSSVQLILDCYDLNLIPHKLIVAHNGRWTECTVHLEGRYRNEENRDDTQGLRDRVPLATSELGRDSQRGQVAKVWPLGSTEDQYGPSLSACWSYGAHGGLIHAMRPFSKKQISVCCSRAQGYLSQRGLRMTEDTGRGVIPGGVEYTTNLKPSNSTPVVSSSCPQILNSTSILGAPPLKLPISSTHFTKSIPISSYSYPHIPSLSGCTQQIAMTNLTIDDEALIQRFIGMHTDDYVGPTVDVPAHATTNIDWSMSLLVKIITDRTVMDTPFSSAMMCAWNADPNTGFRPVMRNSYLVEFTSKEELQKVLLGGPWAFRGDMVASRQVNSQQDLNPPDISVVDMWIQFFNISVNSLTEEGFILMGRTLGTPISQLVKGFVGSSRIIKLRSLIPVEDPLQDRIRLAHPSLGEITVYCHYEKVNRVCRFCGKLGQELVGCPNQRRLSAILQSPANLGHYNISEVLSPKKEPWIVDSSLIPRVGTEVAPTNFKRTYSKTNPLGQNSDLLSGLNERGNVGAAGG